MATMKSWRGSKPIQLFIINGDREPMVDENFLKEDSIDLRTEIGLTQQEMADALGMALRSYQAIEGGRI